MKKTILIFGVISSMIILSCSTKEPAKTKEEIQKEKEMLESQKNMNKLRKSADSSQRAADSIKEVRIHLEEFYDRTIRLTKAGLTESQAIKKVAETDSVGYALYLISAEQRKKK